MIPINIAITGHRDLKKEKLPEYKQKIILILKDIINKYPHSNIQVLSGMAEGADIIGAQAALELGCSLVAVLPMAKEEYIKTFQNKNENLDMFESILLKADKIINLSNFYKNKKSERDSYVQLGVYLTEHAQMIIGLWNGIYSDSPGGTSSVIKFALEGMPRRYRKKFRIVDGNETVPVHYVNVERESSTAGTHPEYISIDKGEYTTLYPSVWQGSDQAHMIEYYDKQLKEIDVFNQNSDKFKNSKSYLKGSDDKAITSLNGITKIIDVQKAADHMAGRWQHRTVRFLTIQLLFGFFVFFWVALVDEIVPFAPYVLFLSPLFFLLCVLTFNYVNKKSIEERYYDYRALAECLRVQFYWKSAGIKENAYSNYSKKNEFELSWVVQAAKNISMDINYELSQKNSNTEYLTIKENWISDQLEYFKIKNKENINTIRKNKRRMYTLFGAGLVFVLLLIVERLLIINFYDSEIIMHILLFMIDASLAGGAIFSGYLDKRQFESEAKQYSRMVMIFNQGIREFNTVYEEGNTEEIKKTIIEMGCDALAENADWVIYNRMSSIDIPIG